jgi:hypothetical protein
MREIGFSDVKASLSALVDEAVVSRDVAYLFVGCALDPIPKGPPVEAVRTFPKPE